MAHASWTAAEYWKTPPIAWVSYDKKKDSEKWDNHSAISQRIGWQDLQRADWQESPPKELCELVRVLSTKVDRLSSEVASLREQLGKSLAGSSGCARSSSPRSSSGHLRGEWRASLSVTCAHGAPELFTETFENKAASELSSYMSFATKGNAAALESLFSKFSSIRDAQNYTMADEAYETMVNAWPSGEVGFEFHNGGGNEKYYRLGCSACRKATKRIYTKGKDSEHARLTRQSFCSIFKLDTAGDLGIP